MKNPEHIAIIMDGNGRWAESRGHNRYFGHIRGSKVVRNIVEECVKKKLKYLTLFAFSTENWKRPREEVQILMVILKRFLKREEKTLMENNVRFRFIGHLEDLPDFAKEQVERCERLTQKNNGMTLTFALSYGGRQEILDAVQLLVKRAVKTGMDPDKISEKDFSQALQSHFLPEPDLLIRTSGENRISNFLLWQMAYTEFYFSEKTWPEFSLDELDYAISDYQIRQRRFGKTPEQTKSLEVSRL